jgi:hypothetical protein
MLGQRAAIAAAAFCLGTVGAGVAVAAAAPGDPTVRVSATTAMSEIDGCQTEPTFAPGSFTLERSDAAGALTVTYHISGGPTDLNADAGTGADHTVDFADGATSVTVPVHPALGGSSATVTVVDGATYDVGDPASATIDKTVAEAACPLAPLLTDAATNIKQTITVGSQPVPLVLGPDTSGIGVVAGALPSGLDLNPDGTWTGKAQEVGTFTVTLCAADPVCAAHGPADFTLVVLPSGLARTGPTPSTVPLTVLGFALVLAGFGLRRRAAVRLR